MKKSDLYREYARVIDICESAPYGGAGIHPNDCVKHNDHRLSGVPYFNGEPAKWEFALAIVEGKPVFKGDDIWHEKYGQVKALEFKNHNLFAKKSESSYPICGCLGNYSWNPPKPKTITVELLRDDAEYLAGMKGFAPGATWTRIEKAAREALDKTDEATK